MTTNHAMTDVFVAVQPTSGLHWFKTARWAITRDVRSRWPAKRLCADALGLVFEFAGLSDDQFVIRPAGFAGKHVELRFEVTSVVDFDAHSTVQDVAEIKVPGLGAMISVMHSEGAPFSLTRGGLTSFPLGCQWGDEYVLCADPGDQHITAIETATLARATREAPEVRFTLCMLSEVALSLRPGPRTPLSLPVSAQRVVQRIDKNERTTYWVKCASRSLPTVGVPQLPTAKQELERLCAKCHAYALLSDVSTLLSHDPEQRTAKMQEEAGAEADTRPRPPAKRRRRTD